MLDLTILAFELTFKYRNPVMILSDGYLGQMTGKVTLPRTMLKPGIPKWAVYGDRNHRKNLISSIYLSEVDLEKHNEHLNEKYAAMAGETRAEAHLCSDLDVLLIACNTPARAAKGAVEELRNRGVKAGLFRPITLWPFPIDQLLPIAKRAKRIIVVEASAGQLEDEVRIALSRTNARDIAPIEHVRRMGGMLPQQDDIVAKVKRPFADNKSAARRPEVHA
jgi:pyruvate/2-oxoacid:ferredoxin oxidoreductase alpha subunit